MRAPKSAASLKLDWLKIEFLKELFSRHAWHGLPTTGMKADLPARLEISPRSAYRMREKRRRGRRLPPHFSMTRVSRFAASRPRGRHADRGEVAGIEVSGFTVDWLSIEKRS